MTNQKSLKEQNAPLIMAALLAHAVAFSYAAFAPILAGYFREPGAFDRLDDILAPGSLSLGLIAIARLVLLGLVPPDWRDRLIHWRWTNPLPGTRAFSKIGPADGRVDMSALAKTYGPLPTDPTDQGRLFYAVYKAHAESVGVLDAHKSYLAARDIGTINLLLFALLPPVVYWATGDLTRTVIYAALLFLSYVLFSLAAQVYAARLVQNTLSVASANDKTIP